jgi:hypothetical protein
MPSYQIDLRQLATPYMFATVRLEADCVDGSKSVGTGFFFNARGPSTVENIFLCTNNHVLEDAVRVRMRLHTSSQALESEAFSVDGERWVTVTEPKAVWTSHPDPEVDLCAAPLSLISCLSGQIDGLFYTSIDVLSIPSDLELSHYPALMPVVMIGYPTGLWDSQNNLPLYRMGSTASHPAINFDGRSEVVVDMACFPGSSGSPVMFHDPHYFGSATRFLGVLYAGPTTTIEGEVVLSRIPTGRTRSEAMMHLGYLIKGQRVRELCNHICATTPPSSSALSAE